MSLKLKHSKRRTRCHVWNEVASDGIWSGRRLVPKKAKVLLFAGYFTPAFAAGGPVRSLENLIGTLGDEIEFCVVTRDRDLGSNEPFPDIAPGVWQPVGKARVMYVGGRNPWAQFRKIIRTTPYDTLYLNSFWDPQFSTLPLILSRMIHGASRRIILAPRGEFSPGAIAIKPVKKRMMLALSRLAALHNGLTWEASSELDAQDIRACLGRRAQDVRVVGNLIQVPKGVDRPTRKLGAPLKIVFLSRISPMKNLDFALKVLASVTEPVCFTIIGPREDAAYANRCDDLIEQLPANVIVREKGALEPSRVVEELSQHDLFFFPTRGENFGHVIAEALQAGLRVLISDQTPWGGLERAGVGFDLPLNDPSAFARIIDAESEVQDDGNQMQRNIAFLNCFLQADQRVAAARQLFNCN
jgi:glycosyltransferase involved in cell wall biosynthesis